MEHNGRDIEVSKNMELEGEGGYNPKEVLDVLKAKGLEKYKCHVCGQESFMTVDNIAFLHINNCDSLTGIETGLGSFVLICKNCGNMQLFSLKALGMYGGDDTLANG
ncbi:MAG: hypothetical protein MRZ54_00310 [Clostridiales bacterium]|nr:hypothetical protein [Clostridiales bacterium]